MNKFRLIRRPLHRWVVMGVAIVVCPALSSAQSPQSVAVSPQSLATQSPVRTIVPGQRVPTTVQAQLRPLGSPSLVDQIRAGSPRPVSGSQNNSPIRFAETSHHQPQRNQIQSSAVRQTVMQFAIPDGGSGTTQGSGIGQGSSTRSPGNFGGISASQPAPILPSPSAPITSVPRTLPAPSATLPPAIAGQPLTISPSDRSPLSAPVLSNQFANVNNSPCVTAPSGFVTSFQVGCGGVAPANFQTQAATAAPFTPPPAQVPAPAILPGQAAAAVAASAAAPAPALLSLGQQASAVQVGPGIFGQPTAYVPGQPFRNWIRYFTP